VPVGTAGTGNNASPTPYLQVHLGPSLALRDTITLPSPTAGTLSVSSMLTVSQQIATAASSTSAATRVLLVSTPNDKALSTNEGSSIWAVEAADIGDQIDELVRDGQLLDAIGLAEAVGETSLSPVSLARLPDPMLILVSTSQAFEDAICCTTVRQRTISDRHRDISRLQR